MAQNLGFFNIPLAYEPFFLLNFAIGSVNNHFLLLKWTLGYLFPAPVHVKCFNTYKGGRGTAGKVFPGQILMLYFSGEYSLTQRWVLAFDMYAEYQGKSTFSGNPGRMTDGSPNPIGTNPSFLMTLSPQIEYNISQRSGLLFGLWASIFGRNTPAFATWVGAYYIAF